MVLIIVVIGALLAMGSYVKRGFQGRWKSSVDDLGDQYDPRVANTEIRHTLDITTNTQIQVFDTFSEGSYTRRLDETISTEKKAGFIEVGEY